MIYVDFALTKETTGDWIGEVGDGDWAMVCSDLETLVHEAAHYISVTYQDNYTICLYYCDPRPTIFELLSNAEAQIANGPTSSNTFPSAKDN